MKKKILFITATHGNEEFSIEVLNKLERKYSRKKFGYERIIGNPKALEKSIRYTDSDLNRSAPGNISSCIYEEKRAAEIMKITEKFKFVIDIHGSIADCGIVIIISKPSIQNIALSGILPIKRIVIWYTKDCLKTGPITQFCKVPGLEIECGPKNNKSIKAKLEKLIEQFLLKGRDMRIEEIMDNLKTKEFYVIYGKLPGKGKGLRDFKEVTRKQDRFYPFMSSNQYINTACYKMKRVNMEDLFLSLSEI